MTTDESDTSETAAGMAGADSTTPSGDEESTSPQQASDLDAAARAELLAEENRRLRSEFARAQQAKYRRTAYGLGIVGLFAVLGGVVLPAAREVLFALGATGLFGGILTRYLTPGQFVTAAVGERIYAAMATNEAAIATELGLSEMRMYVPREETVELYVPQQADVEAPESSDGPILVDEETRGLLLGATGDALFEEFERALTGELAEAPSALATQLADGVVEQFELATGIEGDVETTEGRATFEIQESAFGDLDRFDHPVVSFLAVGFAMALDQPVTVEVVPGEDRTDWLVTCRWDTDGE